MSTDTEADVWLPLVDEDPIYEGDRLRMYQDETWEVTYVGHKQIILLQVEGDETVEIAMEIDHIRAADPMRALRRGESLVRNEAWANVSKDGAHWFHLRQARAAEATDEQGHAGPVRYVRCPEGFIPAFYTPTEVATISSEGTLASTVIRSAIKRTDLG